MSDKTTQWLSTTQRRIKRCFQFNLRTLKERKLFPGYRNLADTILYDLAITTISADYLYAVNDLRALVRETKDKRMNLAMDEIPLKHPCMNNPIESFPNKLMREEMAQHGETQLTTERKEKYDSLLKAWTEHCLKPLPKKIRHDMEKHFKFKHTWA